MNKKNIVLVLVLIISLSNITSQSIPVYLDEYKRIDERIEDALSRMTLEEKTAMIHAQSKFSTPGCPRLGIPELWMSDGPHGVRMEFEWDTWKHAMWTNDSCVAFPALTCLAATFNPELAHEYGKALGAEARFRKKDVILGPGINIYRTPLNGRNFEYMGEDPYLASVMVVPYIQGVQTNGVAACLKHFALNNQEKWRGHINVEVSDRALHEIYLPAFKAGVQEGKVWSVMGAYNRFRGQFTTHHELLTKKILKEDWSFDGVLMSDWGSTHDTREAALNGLDMEMGTRTDGLHYSEKNAYANYYLAQPYLNMIRSGELPESSLDEKVRRVLKLNFRTNMDRNRPYGSFVTEEHFDVARRVAEEGVVLLKNQQNFFPIPVGKYKKILVVGDNADRSLTVAGGSSELKVKKEISPLQGLIEKYGNENVIFTRGYTTGKSKWNPSVPDTNKSDSLRQQAVALAKEADVVLFIGGLNKNYGQDSESNDRRGYNLSFGQDKLIEALLNENKNTGIIIISGNGVSMPWVNNAQAIIQSWYLGSEAGAALANIISGDVNPSGKLPFSIQKRLEDNPAHHFCALTYPGDSVNVHYKEDIFIGYRWHDTKKITPQFAFGHGLSYTNFQYGKIRTDKKTYQKDETVKLSFSLTNTGHTDGAEVVQVYVGQAGPSLPRPVKELKSFKKVFLKAGESKTVDMELSVKELAFYDDTQQAWVVESDRFTFYCASSSIDVRNTITLYIK